MKKVLVTGARGFIGWQTVKLLQDHGYEVHAITSGELPDDAKDVYWHSIDLLNLDQIDDLLTSIKPSHLLHLAWYVTSGQWSSPNDEHIKWVQASLQLIRSFKSNGGQRFVYAGSCMEYDWNYGYCSEYLTPTKPNTFYGAAKLSLHQIISSYAEEEGLSGAWGRPFFLYGPHEKPARLVSSVIRALLNDEPARCSHGNQIRDFQHTYDVANAFVCLLDAEVIGPVNIGSGNPVSLKHIINMIGDKLGKRDLIELGAIEASPKDMPFVVANNRRLVDEVGWQPKYNLDEGLDHVIEWWRQEMLKKG
jgi:nucleoside-diphosphate-sugar epimerase